MDRTEVFETSCCGFDSCQGYKMKITELIPVFVEYIPTEIEKGKVFITKKYCVAVHLCACGCGEKTVMDLKPNWKNGWTLIENPDGTVSFSPSIGNFNGQNPYHAHYFIMNNKIIWC